MSPMPYSDETDALAGVSRVVLRALDALVPEAPGPSGRRGPLRTYLDQMRRAALDPAPQALADLLRQMRRARITSLQIAEEYVPEVARGLGDDWLSDRLDFARVSIASARLQGLLRRLEPDWGLPRGARFDSPPAYLVGVPAGTQHTLGATILAGQLRHRGLSVHLDLHMTPESVAAQVRHAQFSGVMISLACLDHLEICRALVEKAQRKSRDTPVIVGGIVLAQSKRIEKLTGADLATSDLHEALRLCDIRRGTAAGARADRRAAE